VPWRFPARSTTGLRGLSGVYLRDLCPWAGTRIKGECGDSSLAAHLENDDREIAEILEGLASAEPRNAWDRFLSDYSPLLLQVIRQSEHEADAAGDCFVFVCEQLHRGSFRRLRRFQRDGKAKFTTWLRVVVRNLCLDWHRQESGRQQTLETIARLDPFDQTVFQLVYQRGLSTDDCLVRLRSDDPGVTMAAIDSCLSRIESVLTPRQRWLLQMWRPRIRSLDGELDEEGQPTGEQIPDPARNPEALYAREEEHAALSRALERLSTSDRLLLELRYDQELTLLEIARLMGWKDAQRADRRLREILEELRKKIPL
jgi:RNA polymerase sigma factor (sigma-70 family)